MMMSKRDLQCGDGDGDPNTGQLLRDIEEISKALYLPKPGQRPLTSSSHSRSVSAGRTRSSRPESSQNSRDLCENVSYKDKKSSLLWNWKKPLKALARVQHHRFNVCFFLHVHSIECLPSTFNGFSLCVNWKRKSEVLTTHPSKVLDGVAEYEETLMHKCNVYGSKSGPYNSAKYEMKLSLVQAYIVGAPGVDIGKNWVDLTRLLPLTLEELESENSSGKWTTSFKLDGKAKGATLNVSFGFLVTKDNLMASSGNMDLTNLTNLVGNGSNGVALDENLCQTNDDRMLQHVGSIPNHLKSRSNLSSLSVDLMLGREVLPNLGLELSKSINFLYKKLNERSLHGSSGLDRMSDDGESLKNYSKHDFECSKGEIDDESDDFSVVEHGLEICQEESSKLEESSSLTIDSSAIETIDAEDLLKDCSMDLDEQVKCSPNIELSNCYVMDDYCKKQEQGTLYAGTTNVDVEDLDTAFHKLLISQSAELETQSSLEEFVSDGRYMEMMLNYKSSKVPKKSRSLDDFAESVANEFLDILGIDDSLSCMDSGSVPESPRERLLREFENEVLSSGNFILDFDKQAEEVELGLMVVPSSRDRDEDFAFSSVIQASKEQKTATPLKNRRNVQVLENLETEALMREWGLDDKAFQSSPRIHSDGFGSPIELPEEEPSEFPQLGYGFGHLVQINGGGYLQSMNPLLFKNRKNVGHLILQVSKPVVFTSMLGTDIMEILGNLASLGIETLSLQVNKLMPLEDIMGKTMQEVVKDVAPRAVVAERLFGLQRQFFVKQDFCHNKEVKENQSDPSHADLCSDVIDAEDSTGYKFLEDLAQQAIIRIQSLAIEGLRIQSGMSDEGAPSTISSATAGKVLDVELVSQFLDSSNNHKRIGRLLDLSLTLDEWLRLDAGIVDEEDQITEHMLETLAAYHADYKTLVDGVLTRNVTLSVESGRKGSLLGNKITLAFRILLRDPFRNYEAVGSSMLTLVQVERLVSVDQEIFSTALERDHDECQELDGAMDRNDSNKVRLEKEGYQLFKINDVHLAGFGFEPSKKHSWSSKMQQQSATRWLLASGMLKSKTKSFSNSKAIMKSYPPMTRKVSAEDVFWSLTSHVSGAGLTTATGSTYTRNADIIFPKDNSTVL